MILGLDDVRAAQEDERIQPGGKLPDRRRGLIDRWRQQSRIDLRTDQQAQQVHVPGKRRLLVRRVRSGAFQDLLRLAKVRARSDAALQARPVRRTLFSAFATVSSAMRSRSRVRGVGQPCRGDVRHQCEPRRASCRLGHGIAVALNVGQRSQAAEQVDLERVDPDAELIGSRRSPSLPESALALAVASTCGSCCARRIRTCPALRQRLRRRPSGPDC